MFTAVKYLRKSSFLLHRSAWNFFTHLCKAALGSAVAVVVTLVGWPAEPARADDNNRLTVEITALIGTHNLALPLSFIPDPFIGIPASAVTFGTNLGLKHIQAPFVTPGDWAGGANSDDGCTYDFDLDQSRASYSNLLGFVNTRQIPEQWGELTRGGGRVQVLHANTDVKVSVSNQHILPNRDTRQRVSLPLGKHTLTWRAETQISDAFDIIIPAALLAFNASYYGAAFADQGASAVRQAARQDVAKAIMTSIALETGLITASQLGLFGSRTTVTNEREQEITIYKSVPPVIETSQREIVLEATDFGGVVIDRVAQQMRDTINAYDPCGRPFSLSNDAPRLLPLGVTDITWTVSDQGPTPSGGINSRSLTQQVIVRDEQPPIMVPPPSRVIEVPAAVTGINAGEIALGVPRVVDLVDPSPEVISDSPAFFPKNSRTPIRWTATDQSGNSSSADQLITVKTEGENTAPRVEDVVAATLTSEPVDIVLSGWDNDIIDGMPDPLSFRITRRPAHGEFVAPLFPFFIEDYRTNPAGPFGEEFRLTNNRPNWLYNNVCRVVPGPDNQKIPLDWVYSPRFVHVTDDGTNFMIDYYWRCGPSSASANQRISKWDRDGNYLGQRDYGGTNEAFVMDQDGFMYLLSRIGAGSSTTLTLSQIRSNFDELPSNEVPGNAWRFDFNSTGNDPVSNAQFSYARVDSRQGLIYLTDRRRVFVYDVRDDLTNDIDEFKNGMGPQYLGALKNAEQFLCNTGQWGSAWTGFAMEVDPEGNLYVTDSCRDRIHKFSPSYFDTMGDFVMGDYVGWMGRCETSTNNACDAEQQISKGYSCTDATCSVANTRGVESGQFSGPEYIALDPNGVLYVADAGDPNAGGRVQRFSTDGTFGGEARSTGTGVNQGVRPGFVLGNLGTVKAVSVNSTQFFVVDQEESFIHVFETSPLKDITDDSVTVTYVSDFDFHSDVDTFQFVASDGLADSEPGTVFIDVARNFRPPVAFDQAVTTAEDQPVPITLEANDPDGIVGIDFNGLDILEYRIVEPPAHGQLTLISADNATATYGYQPELDYYGEDRFTFVANDGHDDSQPAEVAITVTYVDKPPRVTDLTLPPRIGIGFPFMMHAEFWDDGAEDHVTEVTWGDGTPIERKGDFVEDGDQPRLVGIKLVKPPQGDGIGRAIGQHVYTSTGPKTVHVCIGDQEPRWDCRAQQVLPQHLINLGLLILDDLNDEKEPIIDAGQAMAVEVMLSNPEPAGVAGLVAQSVSLEGAVEGAPVTFTGSSNGDCQADGGSRFTCQFGTLAVGEERLVILNFATDPTLGEDAEATITLEARSTTPAINDVTETFTTRLITAGTGGGTPGQATLRNPAGSIDTNQPTYAWDAVGGAGWYQLWVNGPSGTPVIQQWYTAAQAGCPTGSGGCAITPGTMLSPGAHRWWIQTWNEAGFGPWSEGLDFHVESEHAPAAFIGAWPDDGTYVYDLAENRWTRTTSDALQLAAGDVNGDGRDDLIGVWPSGLWVRYSATEQWVRLSTTPPDNLAVADLTDNGQQDVLGSWSSGLYYRDSETGQWTRLATPAQQLAAGDLDGDGRDDLLGVWGSELWQRDGASGAWLRIPASRPEAIAVGDMTGSGWDEVIGSWSSGVYYRDAASGQWIRLAATPAELLSTGDLTGDGRDELIGVWPDGVWVLYVAANEWQKLSASKPVAIATGRLFTEMANVLADPLSTGEAFIDDSRDAPDGR